MCVSASQAQKFASLLPIVPVHLCGKNKITRYGKWRFLSKERWRRERELVGEVQAWALPFLLFLKKFTLMTQQERANREHRPTVRKYIMQISPQNYKKMR